MPSDKLGARKKDDRVGINLRDSKRGAIGAGNLTSTRDRGVEQAATDAYWQGSEVSTPEDKTR